MQNRHYNTILFFIATTIVVTLAIQGYWNYKNYQAAKQQFINEVQIALDKAVDTYYAELAEENILGISLSEEARHMEVGKLDSIFIEINETMQDHSGIADTFDLELIDRKKMKSISVFSGDANSNYDTLFKKLQVNDDVRKSFVNWKTNQDSLINNPLATLTTRVVYAIKNDSLELPALDTLVAAELLRKRIPTSYSLQYMPKKGSKQTETIGHMANNALTTTATSTFLPEGSTLLLAFNNSALVILKRNSIAFLLSLLFAVAVIACLLYLLKIIRQQKQLAEVKNDLISNITHEFKTPLATIGAAVEGIQTFNEANDPEKNKRYAKISEVQVHKLTGMVEKLLETATLDSEQLQLNKESTDLVALLQNTTNKEAFLASGKNLLFTTNESELMHDIDVFHFENALNNLIDNAIKYGGNIIEMSLKRTTGNIEITISDGGNGLTTAESKQIFEKFYRVPKGNTHDVKGFGIGLYYTKKIVEKHDGTISVSVKPTTFTIQLPT